MVCWTELSFRQSTHNNYSQSDEKLKYTSENKETNQDHVKETNTIDDNKCKDDPANNDDALKNSDNSIGLTAIGNDPRIKRFFTKTYSVVDTIAKEIDYPKGNYAPQLFPKFIRLHQL